MNLLVATFFVTLVHCVSAAFVSLDGNDWFAFNQNNSIRVRAQVPGGIYTDLYRGKVLKSLLFEDDDITSRWVAYDTWIYQKQFSVTPQILGRLSVFLVAHGIDTVSEIFLNGKIIGKTENMFVRYKFDIKPFLLNGTNVLTVKFTSPVLYGKRKSDEQIKNYPIPPLCTPKVQNGECHVNYLRKMQCSFSWDWGPAFPSVGIWKSIGIEAYDYALIRDIIVETIYEPEKEWILNTSLVIESSRLTFPALVKIYLNNTLIFASKLIVIPNKQSMVANFIVPVRLREKIKMWWPNTVGLMTADGYKQFGRTLYTLTAKITPEQNRYSSFSKSIRIGFRTIKLIQKPITKNSMSFYFSINGYPLFMRGSNWIPADIFPERVSKENLENLLRSAKKANINMLRVWGGGIYETDDFYDLADEMGILIWHDFMFAVALYPSNDEFRRSVEIEVEQQVRRLQHHSSIAIWAGNNENEEAIASGWWPQVHEYNRELRSDYIKLYIDTIRPIVTREDTSRIYLPSSPSNGFETEKEGWISSYPQNPKYGDVHFYTYSGNTWDWKLYPSAKFVSEYGFQSFPTLKTMSEAFPIEKLSYPISDKLSKRQHSPNGYAVENMIKSHFNLPAEGGYQRYKDFAYLSQITQAMSIKTETEFYRRNRKSDASGLGFTMGALYWQLNDVWQAPTWSSIEFGGKWKILHYFAKNMFRPILVSPFIDSYQKLKVNVINDAMETAKLRVRLLMYSLQRPFHFVAVDEMIVECNGLSTNQVYEKKVSEILSKSGCEINECILRLLYSNLENTFLSEDFLLFSEPKNLNLQKSVLKVTNITYEKTKPENRFVYKVHLSANSVSLFVWLDFNVKTNIRGHFSNNGFILFERHSTLTFESDQKHNESYLMANIIPFSLTNVVS